MDITTKHTKSTKEENIFFRFDALSIMIFVSFATFVVLESFVGWCILGNRLPEKFTQVAETFNDGVHNEVRATSRNS
jgi:hypothetical protein